MRLVFVYSMVVYSMLLSCGASAVQIGFGLEENIVQPLAIEKLSDILFPTIIQGWTGTLTSTDSVNGSYGNDASLRITGEPNETYIVTGAESGMTLSGPADIFVQLALSSEGSELGRDGIGIIGREGVFSLIIHGTTTIGTEHIAGYYYGEQTIVVGYY